MSMHTSRRPTGPSDALVIVVHTSNSGVVLRLVGRIDESTAPVLVDAINRSGACSPRVVVDLARVEVMDSAGFAALFAAHRQLRAQGSELVLRAVPEDVLRLLQTTGLAFVDPSELASMGEPVWCAAHHTGRTCPG